MANEKRLDLISRDRLLRDPYFREDKYPESNLLRMAIREQPQVDAVEVVHGRWEKASETMPIYRCSICKERNLFKHGNNVLSNYCPNCGAKMDGGNEDG